MAQREPVMGSAGGNPTGWSGQFALMAGSFIGTYHTVSLNVSIPAFADIFEADPASLQWLVTCFMLAAGMTAPISGYLGARFGYKRIFAFCMAGLILTSVCCGLAWNLGSLIAFRTVQGVFSGLIQPVALALLYLIVPRPKQRLAVSVWSAASITASAVAPSASGWFQGVHWPLMFWVTVIPSAAAMIIGLRCLPAAASYQRPGFDGRGMFLAAAASASYLMVFGNLHAWGFGSPAAILGLAAGTLAAVLFVFHELRTPEPMLQLRLFASRTFTASVAVSVVLIAALYAGTYFLPLYFQHIKMYTSFEVGLLFLPGACAVTAATIVSGKFAGRTGEFAWIVSGAALLLVSTWAFSRFETSTGTAYAVFWMCMRNVGIGFSLTPLLNVGMQAVAKEMAGHASALLHWVRQVFGGIGVGCFASLFYQRLEARSRSMHGDVSKAADSAGGAANTDVYLAGLQDTFLLIVVFLAFAMPVLLMLRRKPQREPCASPGENVHIRS